jgi:hypothetical protein
MPVVANAQTHVPFAPVGAEWYYNTEALVPLENNDLDTTSPQFDFLRYVSESDTVLGTDTCRVVKEYGSKENGTDITNVMIFKQEGEKIYYYFNNQFNLIYDYGADVGDTLTFQLPLTIYDFTTHTQSTSTIQVKCVVQNIQNENIGDITVRKILTTIISEFPNTVFEFTADNSYNYRERIGGDNVFMAKVNQIILNEDNAQNMKLSSSKFNESVHFLRCYSDSEVSYISMLWENYNKPCDYFFKSTSIVQNMTAMNNVQIFPNPFEQVLTVTVTQANSMQIFDMFGRMLYSQQTPMSRTKLDLSALPTGLYLLKIMYPDKKTSYHKIVKG